MSLPLGGRRKPFYHARAGKPGWEARGLVLTIYSFHRKYPMPAKDMAEYMRQRRESRRQILLNMAGNECVRCQSTQQLEFNHLDRTTKAFRLTGCFLDRAWATVLAEFEKCELLCADCHKDYTRGQYARKEIKQWNEN